MGTHEHNHPHAEAARERVREGVRRSKLTVDRFREPENKTALKHAAAIIKHDILGFFGEVRNIIKQTEGLESYANCKQSPTPATTPSKNIASTSHRCTTKFSPMSQ